MVFGVFWESQLESRLDYLGIYIGPRLDDFEDFGIDTFLRICLYFAKLDHISMILDLLAMSMIATVMDHWCNP